MGERQTILKAIAADPLQGLSKSQLLSEAECQQLLVEWNDTARYYPRNNCIHHLFEAQAHKTPEAVAVIFEEERLSYAELNERANQLAHYLIEQGVGVEQLVGILLTRSVQMVISLLAVLKAGAAYVPLDAEYPPDRLRYMIEDGGIQRVITMDQISDRLHSTGVQPAGARLIPLDVLIDEIACCSTENPHTDVALDNLSYVIYTSGSTGKPKGAMNTHRGISNRLLWMQEQYQLTKADRVLQKTPFSFDVSVWEFFWPLLVGAPLVLARPGGHQDASYLVRLIIEQEVTTVHFVPAMLQVFLDEKTVSNCWSLRRVICSGEALPVTLQERFFEKLASVELHNLYGPTEAAVDVTYWACRPGTDYRTVPIGRPLANTQIYLLDQHLSPSPIGVPGELYIGGVGLGRGYYHRPELTAESFIPNPFNSEGGTRLYRTGDLARFLPDGNIEFLGRIDHQIKLRGLRIELGEIETVLAQHLAVQEAIVVVREYGPADQRLVAYLIPAQDQALVVRRLLEFEAAGLIQPQSKYELPNGMMVVQLNGGETDFLYQELFEDQSYFKHGIELEPGACVFDVGANIGLFSLFVGQVCPDADLYAFEPIPPVCDVLRINTALYGLRAQVYECGLSRKTGSEQFTYYPHLSIISGRFPKVAEEREVVRSFWLAKEGKKGKAEQTELENALLDELLDERLSSDNFMCQTRTISEVIAENDIKRIDLLKIDVEKSELDVLAGIAKDDWEKIQQIVIELHDIEGRLEYVKRLLAMHGYKIEVEQDRTLQTTKLYNIYARRGAEGRSDCGEAACLKVHGEQRWSSPERLIASVQRYLSERLPEYMVPSGYVLLHQWPLTPSGKVDRRALPMPHFGGSEFDNSFVAPCNSVERALAEIFAEVLGLKRVSIHDDFFKLGGHSLLATQVASRVRDILQIELSVNDVFEQRTVARLAERIQLDSQKERSKPSAAIAPVIRDGYLPLSFAQERVWFLQQLCPTSIAYNFQATLRFTGPLDVPALELTLSEIVRRHEIFRTTFPAVKGRPMQFIHEPYPVSLLLIDLQEFDPEERDKEAQRLIGERFQEPFDLNQLALVRWTLLRLSVQEHVLVHIEHHLVHDGWSFNVFLGELVEIYRAFAAGKPSPLPELAVQFADFASWQREWIQGEIAESQLAYWKKQLWGAPRLLEMPTDRPRPPMKSFRGKTLRIELPLELCESLRAFARREGATLFMTMLAALAVLFHRYTRQEDICIGSAIANRRWRETEELIGMILNNVVLRLELSGDSTFKELLSDARRVTLEAYQHQDVPFDQVVEALQPERNLSHNPLFQVMFGFHDSPLPSLELPNLRIDLLEGLSNNSAKFDMTIIVIPRSEQRVTLEHGQGKQGITVLWEYSTDLFDETTITRLVNHYLRVLEGIVANPEQPIETLLQMSEAERHQLLVEWNETTRSYPRDSCVHQLFETQVERSPEAVAVIFGEEELSYRELNTKANQLAHYLRKQGVGPETLVGIVLERSVELVVGLLAILKAGAAYVPFDPEYPSERLAFMIKDAGISMLLTQQHLLNALSGGGLLSSMKALCLDSEWARMLQEDEQNPVSGATTDNLAYVMYTSGSSGTPKGVAVPHRAVIRLVKENPYVKFGADEVFLLLAPISFDASTFELWGSLLNGARLVIMPPETPSWAELGETLRRYGVTTLWLTAGLFHLLVDERLEDLLGVRQLLAGGDVLSAEHVERYLAAAREGVLINGYGPTENTTFSCTYRMEAGWRLEGCSVPIGRPIANTQVYVLDQKLELTPTGVAGELYLAGDGLARGYLRRPELTAERFVPHPYSADPGSRMYRTGDQVRWLADGTLEFLGRIDQQVKIRGFRIELGEIESVLAQHPDVRDVAVLAREDVTGDKRLVACLIAEPGTAPDIGHLRSWLESEVA